MSPVWSGSYFTWKSSYKGNGICYIGIDNSFWWIRPYIECFEGVNLPSGERLKEFVWSKVNTCKNCGSCFPGTNTKILGKEFKNYCGAGISFIDSDAEETGYVKQMITARRGL